MTSAPIQPAATVLSTSLPEAAKTKEPSKIENVAQEAFNLPFFKSIVSLLGYVATRIGALFVKDVITESIGDKKIEGIKPKTFAKGIVTVIENKAKEILKKNVDAAPLSKEIFGAIVDWQKEAEADEIKKK